MTEPRTCLRMQALRALCCPALAAFRLAQAVTITEESAARGRAFREDRIGRGIRLEDAAMSLGIAVADIYRIERGALTIEPCDALDTQRVG